MLWVHQDQRFFIHFFHMGARFCLFPAFLMSSTCTDKNNPCVFEEQKRHHNSVHFPFKFQKNYFELSFSQETSKLVSVQISFMKNHWIFSVWPWFRSCVSWKTYPYVWTFWLWKFEQSGSVLEFLPECMLIRRQLLVRRNLKVLQEHQLLLRRSFVTQASPVQWRLHRLQSRLSHCQHGVRLALYTSDFCSNSAFLRWQMSINEANWTFFLSLLCFENNLLFALHSVQLPGWNRFEILPFLVHCFFRIRNSHRLWHKNKLVNQSVMGHRSKSFTCSVICVFLRWESSTRCLVDSWDSTFKP